MEKKKVFDSLLGKEEEKRSTKLLNLSLPSSTPEQPQVVLVVSHARQHKQNSPQHSWDIPVVRYVIDIGAEIEADLSFRRHKEASTSTDPGEDVPLYVRMPGIFLERERSSSSRWGYPEEKGAGGDLEESVAEPGGKEKEED